MREEARSNERWKVSEGRRDREREGWRMRVERMSRQSSQCYSYRVELRMRGGGGGESQSRGGGCGITVQAGGGTGRPLTFRCGLWWWEAALPSLLHARTHTHTELFRPFNIASTYLLVPSSCPISLVYSK